MPSALCRAQAQAKLPSILPVPLDAVQHHPRSHSKLWLQESPNAIPEGETPHSVTMLCFEDMIDVAKPGDRVTVTGIYKALPVRANPRQRAVKSVYKTHIMALHVQKDGQSQLFSLSGEPVSAWKIRATSTISMLCVQEESARRLLSESASVAGSGNRWHGYTQALPSTQKAPKMVQLQTT